MALVTVRRSPSVQQSPQDSDETDNSSDNVDEDHSSRSSKSLNECYFANKGAALVLPASAERAGRRCSPVATVEAAVAAVPQSHAQPDIQHHLQSMFYLLRPEETLKMAVKLESAHPGRTRYLVVVCRSVVEEALLLGIDCNERTTIGLVLRVLADTAISLDGDGGFSVCVCGRQHIFKPVSVQAMWSALQTLHRASAKARELNHFAGGASHAWAACYEQRVDSERSCLNEWHAMDSIESRRPPSPNSLRHKPRERDETERVIRCTLKEIMMSVDLDEVTSKAIRGRLEDELDMDLGEFKSFIDQEMLTILGQMDAPTEIFDHVYLGSEWNASNLEELQRNGVRHILNVTREIDNFFPGMFDYLNIRVYDDDKTDLLKHWDNTFKYITKAKKEGSKVLVHCKMGISRSASVVIAYAMKAYNWNFDEALNHVKGKRNCIKPNKNFLNQLETYQGMLDAMKNREKLQRSKSETNLKSPSIVSKTESKLMEPTPLIQSYSGSCGGRPRSWSPDTKLNSEMLPPTSVSLEHLPAEPKHMLMPCANGSYSVSPNQIMRLKEDGVPSVRHIVNEIESVAALEKKKTHRRSFRLTCSHQNNIAADNLLETVQKPTETSPTKNSLDKFPSAINLKNKIHTWDPGERDIPRFDDSKYINEDIVKCDSGMIDLNIKKLPESSLVEKFSEIDEKRSEEGAPAPPSRQSSCSSFDSAVVPDLSRHSSWGSYDTRPANPLASAARPLLAPPRDDTPHNRAKHKHEDNCKQDAAPSDSLHSHKVPTDLTILVEREASWRECHNERKFNETCAILKEAGREWGGAGSTWGGRMAASAPTESWARGGRVRVLPARLRLSHSDLPRARDAALAAPLLTHPTVAAATVAAAAAAAAAHSAHGIVKNLKMEFEARSSEPEDSDTLRRKTRSLVLASHPLTPPPDATDDLSVKLLVDKYDSHSCKSRCEVACDSKSCRRFQETASKKSRVHSEGEVSSRPGAGLARSGTRAASADKPPVAPHVVAMPPINYPSVVMASVLSKAQTKKQLQHGKTHPLTRLNINRQANRCSNPVYNTM